LVKTFPIVYALMTSKKQGLYKQIIDHVNEVAEDIAGQKLNPSFVMSDFEMAILAVMSSSFPNARVRGCWFHFCQAIYKYAQKLGLKALLNNNEQ